MHELLGTPRDMALIVFRTVVRFPDTLTSTPAGTMKLYPPSSSSPVFRTSPLLTGAVAAKLPYTSPVEKPDVHGSGTFTRKFFVLRR